MAEDHLRIEGLSDPVVGDESSERFRIELSKKRNDRVALDIILQTLHGSVSRAKQPQAAYEDKLKKLRETLERTEAGHRLAHLELAAFRKDRIPLHTQREEARAQIRKAEEKMTRLRTVMSLQAEEPDARPKHFYAAAYMEVTERWKPPLPDAARRVREQIVAAVEGDLEDDSSFDPENREADLDAIEQQQQQQQGPPLETRANRALLGRMLNAPLTLARDLFETRALRREFESQFRLKWMMQELIGKLDAAKEYEVEALSLKKVSARESAAAGAHQRAALAYDRFFEKRFEAIERAKQELSATLRHIELLNGQIDSLDKEIARLRREEPRKARTFTVQRTRDLTIPFRVRGAVGRTTVSWRRENEPLWQEVRNIRKSLEKLLREWESAGVEIRVAPEGVDQVIEVTFADDIGTVQFTFKEWTRLYDRTLPDGVTLHDLDRPPRGAEQLGERGNEIRTATRRHGGWYTCRVEDESGAVAEDAAFVVVQALSYRTNRFFDMNANVFGSERFNRWRTRGLRPEREIATMRFDARAISSFIDALQDEDLYRHLAEKWDRMRCAMECVAWRAWLESKQGRDTVRRMRFEPNSQERVELIQSRQQRAFHAMRARVAARTRVFWNSITLAQFKFWFRPRALAAAQWHKYRKTLEDQLRDTRPKQEKRDLPGEQPGAWADLHSLSHRDITEPNPMFPWIRPSERTGVGIDYARNAPRRPCGASHTLEELEFFYLVQRYDGARNIPRASYPWVFDANMPKGPGLELPERSWLPAPKQHEPYRPPRWTVRRERREVVREAREHRAHERSDFGPGPEERTPLKEPEAEEEPPFSGAVSPFSRRPEETPSPEQQHPGGEEEEEEEGSVTEWQELAETPDFSPTSSPFLSPIGSPRRLARSPSPDADSYFDSVYELSSSQEEDEEEDDEEGKGSPPSLSELMPTPSPGSIEHSLPPPMEIQRAAAEIRRIAERATEGKDVLSAADKIEAIFSALGGDGADESHMRYGESLISQAREEARALDRLNQKIEQSRTIAQRSGGGGGEHLADSLMLHGLDVTPTDDAGGVLDAVQKIAQREAKQKVRYLADRILTGGDQQQQQQQQKQQQQQQQQQDLTQSAIDALEFASPISEEFALDANLGESEFLEHVDAFFGTKSKSTEAAAASKAPTAAAEAAAAAGRSDETTLDEIDAFLEDGS